MKNILTYLLCFIVLKVFFGFVSCNEKTDKKIIIKAVINVNPEIRNKIIELNVDLIPIEISIINNTDTNLVFWLMSCSWQDNFIFDKNYIHLYNKGCDINQPILKNLKPTQSLFLKGFVQVADSFVNFNLVNLKFAFLLLEKSKFNEPPIFSKTQYYINNRQNLIWSDNIEFIK